MCDRHVDSISKCGDPRVRTLLYEAANIMLTRYTGQLKLKDWAPSAPAEHAENTVPENVDTGRASRPCTY